MPSTHLRHMGHPFPPFGPQGWSVTSSRSELGLCINLSNGDVIKGWGLRNRPNRLTRELCIRVEGRISSVPGVWISTVGCKCVPLPHGMLQFSHLPSTQNTGHNSLKLHSSFLWMFGSRSTESQNSCTGFKEIHKTWAFSFYTGEG